MQEELNFLRTWGLAFRQAFKDNPERTYFQNFERLCLDAYNAFSPLLAQRHFARLETIEGILLGALTPQYS